jgi:hypothetical protein
MNRFGAGRLWVVAMAFAGVLQAAHASSHRARNQSALPVAAPPAVGEYSCHVLAVGGSIMTPYGAAPTVTPMPSGIVRVWLDEDGHYRQGSGQGRYRYQVADSRVVFESGPLAGFVSRSEANGERHWIRFAARKGGEPAPKSRLGEHICVLKRTNGR